MNGDGFLDLAIGCDNIGNAMAGLPHSRLYVFNPKTALNVLPVALFDRLDPDKDGFVNEGELRVLGRANK